LFIHSGFHRTLIRSPTSVFEVTTVWRYINSIISIIIIFAHQHKNSIRPIVSFKRIGIN